MEQASAADGLKEAFLLGSAGRSRKSQDNGGRSALAIHVPVRQ
ncbi:Protein of unknown function, partial [Gryllus bimaculatus]